MLDDLKDDHKRLVRTETRLAKLMVHLGANPYYESSAEAEERGPMVVIDIENRRVDTSNIDVSLFEIKRQLFEQGQQEGYFEWFCNGRNVATVYL